jgi:type II secretory pathway pseudopilin PulG
MMQFSRNTKAAKLGDRRGFTLPVVILGIVFMSTIAVVVVSTSTDEQKTSRAVRASMEAFYAAESGLNAVQSTWNDTTATLDSLAHDLQSGATLDLGWSTLADGSSYKAGVMRLNNAGTQNVFLVSVVGRDASGHGGERALVNRIPGELKFGGCCESAAMIRGAVDVNSRTGITGTDTDPPSWGGGVCDEYDPNDQPGLTNDGFGIDSLDISSSGFISSGDSITNDESYRPEPAIVEDNSMDDMTFDEYGTKTWEDVRNMATTTIGNGNGPQVKLDWGGDPVPNGQDDKFGPRYHNLGDGHGHPMGDPLLGSCDYGHPLNFGAPSGPCADHFPVILVQGEIEIKDMPYEDWEDGVFTPYENWYIQGVVILDTLPDGQGSEFELESPGTLAGMLIGKGCIQLQDGSQTFGAVFVDGNVDQETCENPPLELNRGDDPTQEHTDLYYSECVIQRVLRATGMGEETGEGGGSAYKFISRAFSEILR